MFGHFAESQAKCSDDKFIVIVSGFVYLEAIIMSMKPDRKLEMDEIKFFGELGWFATLSVAVASFAPLIADVLG
jgi:hypothetical protein